MLAVISQEVFEPQSINDALEILKDKGSDATIIAGGTDVIVRAKDGVIQPKNLVDIISLPLDYVKGSLSEGFKIGATTSAASIWRNQQINKELPVLCEAGRQLGGPQTQELATIGGNICNASPGGNFPNVLLALDTRLKIAGRNGDYEIALSDFFLAPGKTKLKKGEILTEIIIPPIPANHGIHYIKHVLRKEMDIAIAGVAVMIVSDNEKIKSIKIALGSVGPTPFLAINAQSILEGKIFSKELVEAAAEAAQKEASYIDDVRGSAKYRKTITYALVKNAIVEAWTKAKGGK